MTNKYRPHILVLPEDDADRQIANGFLHSSPDINERAIQILPPAGGWKNVIDEFTNVHAREMRRWCERRMVLVIDLDGHLNRLDIVRAAIPEGLGDRVFVLGVLSDPEKLRSALQDSLEEIGKCLSQDCANNTRTVWAHELLMHNEVELDRMAPGVRPFLCS